MARAEAPPHLGVIGLGMAGPTIIAHGTDAQKAKHLEKILSTEEIWCQGFSEPDAGSDLSAVRTTARRENGHFVVDGQKVWSSFAHIADWCILVTRSDPESQRHAGLTYLLVDMHAPGRRGAAAAPDHRRGRVQRDLLHRRRGAGGERRRRRRRRLAGGDDDAAARARHARLRAHRRAREPDPEADRAREGAGRDAGAARRDRPRVDRPAGGALHELPLADDADEDRASPAPRARARSSGGRRRTSG